MKPSARARVEKGLLPYPHGGRQATKNDILNLGWVLGMPLDEEEPVGELVARLFNRVAFLRDTLKRIATTSQDSQSALLAKTALGETLTRETLTPHNKETTPQ